MREIFKDTCSFLLVSPLIYYNKGEVMLMISNAERKLLEQEILRDIESNPEYGLAAFKLIYNLLSRITPDQFPEHPFTLVNPADFKSNLLPSDLSQEMLQLLNTAFEYATDLEKPKYYTTGQISSYFGVSITTINNWLREKRISYNGMDDKPTFKQSRIPDTAIYKAPNGQESLLREVIQSYESRKEIEQTYDNLERIKELVNVMKAFEEKYGGKYEEVVARLGEPESSNDWQWSRDADEWRYVVKELVGER